MLPVPSYVCHPPPPLIPRCAPVKEINLKTTEINDIIVEIAEITPTQVHNNSPKIMRKIPFQNKEI